MQNETQSTNPKDAIGRTKPPMHLIPPVALVQEAVVMGLGADKYGPYNWRDHSVAASVYVAAALRHISQWFDGRDDPSFDNTEDDPESGASHLAHARACLGILLDAQSLGKLVDDRPARGRTTEVLAEHTKARREPGTNVPLWLTRSWEVGDRLATRDGRRVGNGQVIEADSESGVYRIRTDHGNTMTLTTNEVLEFYHNEPTNTGFEQEYEPENIELHFNADGSTAYTDGTTVWGRLEDVPDGMMCREIAARPHMAIPERHPLDWDIAITGPGLNHPSIPPSNLLYDLAMDHFFGEQDEPTPLIPVELAEEEPWLPKFLRLDRIRRAYAVHLHESLGCRADVARTVAEGLSLSGETTRRIMDDREGPTGTPTVYVAGPMRGYPEFNFPAFDAARDRYVEAGWGVFSPADMGRSEDHGDPMDRNMSRQQQYAYRDLMAIMSLTPGTDDGIVVLPGWEQSTGAVAEVMVARWLGLKVYEGRDESAVGVPLRGRLRSVELIRGIRRFLESQEG